jgi:hypothetical protein
MKRIFVVIACILVFSLSTVWANDGIAVSASVKQSFKKEFPGVESVQWDKSGDYRIATFIVDNHRVQAYFDSDGEMLGYARNMLFGQLPMRVTMSVDKAFPGTAVYNIQEVVNPDGTFYWLTVETAEWLYRIQLADNGKIIQKSRHKPNRP